MITQSNQAILVAQMVKMSEALTVMMDILVPDAGSTCPHPADQIEHEETMDDVPTPYHCRACGAEQAVPFHSET